MGVKVKVKGNLLKTCMVKRGYTLEKLSKVAKIAEPTMRRALKGEALSPKTVYKIINNLGEFSLEDFVVFGDE